MQTLIRRRVEPAERFGIQIRIADELAPVDEIGAQIAHGSLDLAFCLCAIGPARPNAKAPVPGKAEKLWILEELAALSPLVVDDHRFELIKEQFVRHATEIRKGGLEAGDDRRERLPRIELHPEQP